MARYRSSPTCSSCWGRGHTKRSCPQMKERAATWLKDNEHLKGTNEYYKPYYVQEVEGYAASVKNRKCSWCDEHGHNKRSCPQRKNAATKNIEKNKEWRAEVLKGLKKKEYGVGALLASKRDHAHLYMIVDMCWKHIHLRTSSGAVARTGEYSKSHYKHGLSYPEMTLRAVNNNQRSSTYYPVLHNASGDPLFHYSTDDYYEVVSGVQPRPPTDWINDESWAKELF